MALLAARTRAVTLGLRSSRPLVPRAAIATRAQRRDASAEPSAAAAALAVMPLLHALPAHADDAVTAAADVEAGSFLGVFSSPTEFAILLSPIILYAGWNYYRSTINPKASFNDFLLLMATAVIVGNIVGIVFFKVRIF